MKKTKITATFLLSLFISVSFAQMKEDSLKKPSKEKRMKSEVVTIEKETIFGYHHNNYKQPVKAQKAQKWFRTFGSVNDSATATNYKMPFKKNKEAEKTIIKSSDASKRSRNYKRPYSNN
ncbi:MAG: hypothetical protein ACI9V1_002627 [Spirosomataceae bacterium]|jgi:hypothetical protein